MDTKTKIILGIIGGIAAATIITMIMAPEKMEEFKKQFKDKASDFADEMDCMLNDVKDQLADVVKKAEKRASNMKM